MYFQVKIINVKYAISRVALFLKIETADNDLRSPHIVANKYKLIKKILQDMKVKW